jgi:hypothetical protein
MKWHFSRLNCAEKHMKWTAWPTPTKVIFLNLNADFGHLEKTPSGQPLPKIFSL